MDPPIQSETLLYFSSNNFFFNQVYTRAVNPPHLQILRIDGKEMINDVIMTTAHDIIVKKTAQKRCWIVIFDLIGLLPTNHIIAYIIYNGIPVRKCLMLTVK